METTSLVFEKHYTDYLEQISSLDFDALALKLGGNLKRNNKDRAIELTLLGHSYEISSLGIRDGAGERPMYDICIILWRHLLMCPEILPGDREWVAFRDLKNSGPLTVYFRDNVEQAIARKFVGKTRALERGMASLNGVAPNLDVHYDLAMQVAGLPKIP